MNPLFTYAKRATTATLLAGGLLTAAAQAADEPPMTLSGSKIAAQSGATIYQSICQACHQADAQGAQGAGFYPALAGNMKLAAADFPVYVVLNGQNGMPPLRGLLDDAQIAEVVNYVRSHFGNHYQDQVTAEQVAAKR